ncbi:MAG: hypothetical protein ACREQP_08365, partial [Candidatus Binatia bacterium]
MTKWPKSWIARILLGFLAFWLILLVAHMLSLGLGLLMTTLFVSLRADGLPIGETTPVIASWIVLLVRHVCSAGLWWTLWK